MPVAPDKLVALDEAQGLLDEAGAILQDIERSTASLRTKLEEATVAVEAIRDPIEISEADDFAAEHDFEDEYGMEGEWDDDGGAPEPDGT